MGVHGIYVDLFSENSIVWQHASYNALPKTKHRSGDVLWKIPESMMYCFFQFGLYFGSLASDCNVFALKKK